MKRWLMAAALVTACGGSPTDEDGWQRRVGEIYPEMSSIQMLTMPTEVRLGVPFDVTVRTLGSSSCTRAAGLKAERSGARLDLTPYDEVAVGAAACTDDLHAFEHTARVSMKTVGLATVRVHGRRGDKSMTYEMQITVLP